MTNTLNTPSIELWPEGSLIRVKRNTATVNPPAGGRRGKVTKFSFASRRRLLRTIARLRKSELPLFITLTYPNEYSKKSEVWKQHLRVWAARLRRRYPGVSFIWRLEFQRRGAPHFHLLVYGVIGNIKDLQAWLSQSWYEVVASPDETHFLAGTSAEEVRSFKGVMSYAGKELGKVSQAILGQEYADGVGRWWGAFYRNSLPWASSTQLQVSEAEASHLLRLMRRYAKLKSRSYQSLTIFCDADWWFRRLPELLAQTK